MYAGRHILIKVMYKLLKRIMDLIISIMALTILSPILLICALILLFTGENQVLYFQERVGLNNKKFYIWKFATMLKDSPNIGLMESTTRNDPRVLPFGRILRMTKINELPQIVNVLIGDMSIVGPRPLTPKGFDNYSVDLQQIIYRVKPGITGVGSIVFRDEEFLVATTKKDVQQLYREDIMPRKGALELWYQNNRSILVDIKIIFLTAWVILFPSSRLYTKLLKGIPKQQ